MKKIKIILALAAFYFLFSAAWQVGACELANIELKDDLQDMVSQLGVRIGASDVASDDDLRTLVLRKAEKYNIALAPEQVKTPISTWKPTTAYPSIYRASPSRCTSTLRAPTNGQPPPWRATVRRNRSWQGPILARENF
jgi:hypothetical protein